MKWYNYTYYTILLFGVVIFFIRYKYLTVSQRYLGFALVVIFITEITGRIFREVYGKNIVIYSLLRPIQFTLVGISFLKEMKKKWVMLSIIFYFLFHITNLLYFQKFGDIYDSYSVNLANVINTVWCLSYLYLIFENPVADSLFELPLFWPTCGYLFFNAVTMIVFATLGYTNDSTFNNAFEILHLIRVFSSHFLYITFFMAFIQKNK